MRHTLETYSGLYFDFDDPRPEQVDVADIAKALSWTCRFGGHVSRGISVAEHAVLVYELTQPKTRDPELLLAALHHDSHEAYLGDIPTPLKAKLGPRYRELVHEIDEAIGDHLGIDLRGLVKHPIIKAGRPVGDALRGLPRQALAGRGGALGSRDAAAQPRLVECRLPDSAEALFRRVHTRAMLDVRNG
jgi:hypothetical protein